ncbi:conserved protein of unknown function [Modestobacter italicus]|uniref:Uncharacterized protein n=1 Tax=Modestobacter italicus (strain DSM 44449 / CECT 9708 / BC 501) TaxID=2732864 RepID=I4EYQ4_MODI5|nr:hypothetical protein [Modestobacter marinus]CCH88517.1 conserved protein of unknown function [Modestobacter marinus]
MAVDIEQQINRVWTPDVRPTVAEAWRCYGAGAYRACIALTWAAVCADLIDKIIRLADEGEGDAASFATKVASARAAGISVDGVRDMQEVERICLDTAVKLDVLDDVTARELERLREDRHLCVHPSLRGFGETYAPTAEYARAHLAVALDELLTQPPVQGRKAVQQLVAYVMDPQFVSSPGHITHVFHDRVRPNTRRQLIELAVKHAVLELPVEEPPGGRVVAERMHEVVQAFLARDRDAVTPAISKVMDRLAALDSAGLTGAIGRVGDLDVLWELLPAPLVDRIADMLAAAQLPTHADSLAMEDLTPEQVDLLSPVGSAAARARIPLLVTRFGELTVEGRASVMARRVSRSLVMHVPEILRDAYSFRAAEGLTQRVVLPYAPLLDLSLLEKALMAWAENSQCRTAMAMQEHAARLYEATSHLRPADRDLWKRFVERVREVGPGDSYYRYENVERLFAEKF